MSEEGHEIDEQAKKDFENLTHGHELSADGHVEDNASTASNKMVNGDKPDTPMDGTLSVSLSQAADTDLDHNNHCKVDDTENVLHSTSDPKHQNDPEILRAQSQEENKQINGLEVYEQQAVENHFNFVEDNSTLRKQLEQSIMALSASKELMSKLQEANSNAERRAEEATANLVEVEKKLEEELKARDKKYTELDAKFSKLQKRAKQRIQEVQKEKEDVELQLAAASKEASEASAQCASLLSDLERVRAQAGDALRSLDAERQQLRSTTNKQKEAIEELHHKLEAKEHECKEAQRITSEKEQVVNELTGKMMEMEKNHEKQIAEMVLKHQKLVEDLEAQLGDAVKERNKSAETIASLQMELAAKDSYIAEKDAVSSGEVIRLTASLDSTRAELTRIEKQHEKEKETWTISSEATKLKLEETEKAHVQREIFFAKEKSQLESELQGLQQALSLAQAESSASKAQVATIEKEFNAYKVRAHSLLQKKEAELCAAKDTEKLAAQEAALEEARRVASSAVAERDRAIKDLKEASQEHESQLGARNVALMDAQQKIRELAANIETSKARMQIKEEEWESRLDEVNRIWEEKYNALMEKSTSKIALEQEISLLMEKYARIQEEHSNFQEMANKMLESKDQEIARLLEEGRQMQKIISDAPKVSREVPSKQDPEEQFSVGEQQILMLARQQAQREEELAQCHRHIQALQEEIAELEHENRLHAQQEAALKEEFRNLERSRKREGVDMTYLKNVILKLLETGEVEALLPVVAMLLQFSREELKKCQEVYNVVPDSSAAGGPPTLFSRFLFSKAGK